MCAFQSIGYQSCSRRPDAELSRNDISKRSIWLSYGRNRCRDFFAIIPHVNMDLCCLQYLQALRNMYHAIHLFIISKQCGCDKHITLVVITVTTILTSISESSYFNLFENRVSVDLIQGRLIITNLQILNNRIWYQESKLLSLKGFIKKLLADCFVMTGWCFSIC